MSSTTSAPEFGQFPRNFLLAAGHAILKQTFTHPQPGGLPAPDQNQPPKPHRLPSAHKAGASFFSPRNIKAMLADTALTDAIKVQF